MKGQGSSREPWWKAEGLRFECQGSGQCCTSRGEYGYVYLTLEDRKRMARALGLSTLTFTRTLCVKEDGYFRLKQERPGDDCRFLKNNRCSVYAGRPTQCRTWPFWPELLKSRKAWNREVTGFCPGVGKGPVRSPDEIETQRREQARADAGY